MAQEVQAQPLGRIEGTWVDVCHTMVETHCSKLMSKTMKVDVHAKVHMSNLKLKMQCMFCHLQIKVTRWSSFDENFSIDCKGDGVVIATSHQDGGYEARTNKRENCVRPWCSRGGGGMCRETY